MRQVALTLAATLAACTTASDPGGTGPGDGKADGSGDSFIGYIQSNTPFYWAASEYPDFQAAARSIGLSNPDPIAATDALTARLQGWVDRIDAIVRDEVQRATGSALVAPKPIVEVLPTGSTFNAWVSPVVACTGITPPNGDPTTQSLLRGAQVSNGTGYACVRPAWQGGDALRTFWNRAKPACALGADLTPGGAACAIDAGALGELEVFATSPYIHVTTDLIAAVDERTLAVVLAHELGHYYRAHVTDAVLQKYDFWYDTEIDRKKRPVPAANAAALQAAYGELVAGPRTVQAAVAGHYSPRLRTFLLTAIAPLLAERTEPGFVCAGARDALGPWTATLLDGYGAPTDATTSYLAFERALVTCAPRLDLRADPDAHTLSYGRVLMAVFAAKLTGATFPFYASLADVLGALDARAVRLDQKAAALSRQVAQNRIGLYTIEQEADDIAMEISTRLGIAPDQVLAAWLDFMRAIAAAVPSYYRAQYDAEYASCNQLLADGFTTTDGSGAKVAAFVPIGDLGEPHHSDCYRLFNFWRDQQQRQYTVATPLAFPDDWATLQAEARQLSADAASRGQ
jgi:hypothetical protein